MIDRFGISAALRTGPKAGAAVSLLNRIIADERDRSTLVLCWIRAVLACLNAVAVVPVAEVRGLREVWPTRYGAVAYAVFAVTIVVLAKLKPQPFLRWAAFAPAIVDVPLIGLLEWKQATYAIEPGLILVGATAEMLCYVMLSTLALSRVLMILVTPPAILFIALIASVEGTPWPVRLSLFIVLAGTGALGWVLVGKIRRLVRTSRERDLLGKYVLGPRLGAGGMAEVFKATYSPEGGFERAVAVKRILPQYGDNPEIITLFRREAELGARLAHPNIVQVLDFGADGETFFMAMEFIDGVSLARIMVTLGKRGARPSVALLLYLAHELAESLAYIHSRTTEEGAPLQLIHRDFNPPNVMVSRIGEVKVADFGIARSVKTQSLTSAGQLRGKLAYAAPEQIRSETIDHRVDLFALGVMLYEFATMQPLFRNLNEVDVLNVVLKGTTPPLHSVEPSLPIEFCSMVDALLVRDVALRLGSADEVLALIAHPLTVHDALKVGRAELALLSREVAALPPSTVQQQQRPDPDAETRVPTP